MAIPSAARRASKKADKIHAESYGPKDKKAEPVVEAKAEPVVEETPAEETTATGEVDTAPVEVAGETKPVEPVAEDTTVAISPKNDWEHKYKVLQGMYNAEVPRMTKDIRDLKAELEGLKKAPVQPVADVASALISDKEKTEYGADLIDVMKRAAREEFLPEIQRLKEENSQLKNSVGDITETASESARTSVYTRLTDEIPNWQQINSDQKFITWLQDIDIYSGQTRNTMIQQAFERNDAQRVLAFFKGYLDEVSATVAHSTAPAAVTPVAQPAKKVPVDALVAPGTPGSTGGTTAAQANTQIWTQAQISAFYRDVQKGAFKGREAEKTKIERDIIAAVSEQRISA